MNETLRVFLLITAKHPGPVMAKPTPMAFTPMPHEVGVEVPAFEGSGEATGVPEQVPVEEDRPVPEAEETPDDS